MRHARPGSLPAAGPPPILGHQQGDPPCPPPWAPNTCAPPSRPTTPAATPPTKPEWPPVSPRTPSITSRRAPNRRPGWGRRQSPRSGSGASKTWARAGPWNGCCANPTPTRRWSNGPIGEPRRARTCAATSGTCSTGNRAWSRKSAPISPPPGTRRWKRARFRGSTTPGGGMRWRHL